MGSIVAESLALQNILLRDDVIALSTTVTATTTTTTTTATTHKSPLAQLLFFHRQIQLTLILRLLLIYEGQNAVKNA
jgi:hypothetical protein